MIYNPYGDTSVYLGTLQLPHVTSITWSSEWTQTELPIEAGAVISDHRRRRPRTVSISGYVTGQVELVPSPAGVMLGSTAIRSALNLYANTGRVFVLKFGQRIVPNMSIVGIEEEDLAERRDDMWSFTLNLAETRVATSTLAVSVPVDPGVADLTAAPVDGGPQSATAVGPESAGTITGVVGGGV